MSGTSGDGGKDRKLTEARTDGQREQRGWGSTPTPYEAWVRRQGVPIVEGYGLTDLSTPRFGPWDRISAEVYFSIMRGMEGITGMYVARLPAGGSTTRERHLYEKVIYVLQGSGATVVEDPNGREHTFEWHDGSLFAIPLNAPHRIYAMGEPVMYAAFTTAPLVFDLFYNEEFVYNTPYYFTERFAGEEDYFSLDQRRPRGEGGEFESYLWETNFIPDVRTAQIDPSERKGPGLLLTQFEIASNSLIGHLAEWPVGRYVKAHYHGGGAILLIIKSVGFSLMWPNDLGERPYENGHGDQVVRIDWQPGSAFSPPTGWYHQHFNTGPERALQLALRNGSAKFPFGVRRSQTKAGTMTSTAEGGTMIDFENEDPAIRRIYVEALERNGVKLDMPPITYAARA